MDKEISRIPFDTFAHADSFHSELVSAAQRGEAFDVDEGLSLSMVREKQVIFWFDWPPSTST